MRETALMRAVSVGNHLVISLTSFNTAKFIVEKGLMNVVNVGNLVLAPIIIREFTVDQGLMITVNVGNLLLLVLPSVIIREFTQEKDVMSARSVENVLCSILPCVIIIRLMLEIGFMSALYMANFFFWFHPPLSSKVSHRRKALCVQ